MLLTSGQVLCWDENDEQLGEIQSINANKTDRFVLSEVVKHANKFSISKWREWSQELTKEEFINITGL